MYKRVLDFAFFYSMPSFFIPPRPTVSSDSLRYHRCILLGGENKYFRQTGGPRKYKAPHDLTFSSKRKDARRQETKKKKKMKKEKRKEKEENDVGRKKKPKERK